MCILWYIIYLYICCIIKSWYSMPAVVPKQQFTTDWKIWQDTFHECRWRDNQDLRLCFPSKTPPVLPFRPSYGCLKIPSLFTPFLYNYGPWRFPKMGVPPKSSILVLKPMVTWGSPILRNTKIYRASARRLSGVGHVPKSSAICRIARKGGEDNIPTEHH